MQNHLKRESEQWTPLTGFPTPEEQTTQTGTIAAMVQMAGFPLDWAAEGGCSIHKVKVLQARRMREWGCPRGLCIASWRLLRAGSLQQGQTPCKKALRGHLYETVKVKPRLKWKLKDVVLGPWEVYQGNHWHIPDKSKRLRQNWRRKLTQALWGPDNSIINLEYLTQNYRS